MYKYTSRLLVKVPPVIVYVRFNLFWAFVNSEDTIAYLFLHSVVCSKGSYEIFAEDSFQFMLSKAGTLGLAVRGLITFKDTPGEAIIEVNGWFAVLEDSRRIGLVVNVPLVLVMARLFYWQFLSEFKN